MTALWAKSDIRPAPVQVALDPELTHGEEVVVRRLVEVEDTQAPLLAFTPVVADDHRYAILEQPVLLAVRGQDCLGGAGFDDLTQRVVVHRVRQAGVEGDEFLAQIPGEHHLAFVPAAQVASDSLVLALARWERVPRSGG
jgi:hypothetical protein